MNEGNQQCTTNECQYKTKQIATATVDGTMKIRRPHTKWKDVIEEDLSIMGMKKGQPMARDRREWRNGVGSQGSKKECSTCG
jgi:hypothetical protein